MRILLFRPLISSVFTALIINLLGITCIHQKEAIAQVPYLSASDPLMVDLNPQRNQTQLDYQLPSLALPDEVLEGTLTFGEYEDYARLPDIGQRYYQAGEFQVAAQYWQTAQEFYKNLQVLGEDRIFEVLSLEAYHQGTQQGLFNSPEEFIQYAASQEERLLDVLGITSFQLGLLDLAVSYFDEALIKAEHIQDTKMMASTLNNLGFVYQKQGLHELALENYSRALSLANGLCCDLSTPFSSNEFRKFTFYTDHLTVDILINIGHLYQELGQHQKALSYFNDAFTRVNQLAISSFSQPLQPSNYGSVWANDIFNSSTRIFAGSSLAKMGQHEKGIQLISDGLAIAHSNQDATRQFLALKFLNPALISSNRLDEASRKSFELIEQYEKVMTRLTDYQLLQLFEELEPTYEFLQTTLIDRGKIESALEIAERARARASVSQIATNLSVQRRRIRACNNGRISENVENRISDCSLLQTSSLQRAVIDPKSREEEEALTETIDINAIKQLAASKQATIVQYSTLSNQKLYIWVVKPDHTVHFHQANLNEIGKHLSPLIENTRKSLGVRSRGFELDLDPLENGEMLQTLGDKSLRELYDLLIQPIKSVLPTDSNQHVIFIPQGELFLVPFPALKDNAGRYLIEHHTILTAPSIQLLNLTQPEVLPSDPEPRRQRSIVGDVFGTVDRVLHFPSQIHEWFTRRNDRQQSSPEVLIVGNPKMPELRGATNGYSASLSNLPYAESEAKRIADFFETDALIGQNASEWAVKQRMGESKVIHLATHGLLDYEALPNATRRDLPGAIALTPGQGEDGLLTSAEVLEHFVFNTDLVALSACDTGVGTISGDGVIGLSRSFILSGASSVMVSLWSVPDGPTADLMTEFYRQWLELELDKAQALRQAMLVTMQQHPEPRDWAAFTLIGEPK
ncbi:MAG: CHAT domain-containing protein [Cyanothece sp. SIO1E1]|nr:CHAT domain-containing protein [Cyanothece sp. SIO1E1]